MSEITIYEPNYTQIPNSVISAMPKLSEAEFKVIMAICRKTFGYHKEKDRISLSQLETLTGMSRSSITNALKGEQLKRLIKITKTKKGNVYEPIITPNKSNEASTKSELPKNKLVRNLNQTSTKSEPSASSKSEHTKENSTKENKQKKGPPGGSDDLPLPQQIEQAKTCKALSDIWYAYRRRKAGSNPNMRNPDPIEVEMTQHEMSQWGMNKTKMIMKFVIRNGYTSLREDYLPDGMQKESRKRIPGMRTDAIMIN